MWEHPYAVCMCPVALLGELGLAQTQVMPFFRVNWQFPPWKEVGLEKEELEPKPCVR